MLLNSKLLLGEGSVFPLPKVRGGTIQMKLSLNLTAAEMDKSYEIANKINALCGNKVLDMAEIAEIQKDYTYTTEAATVKGNRDDEGNITVHIWIDEQLSTESADIFADAMVGIVNICMTTVKFFKGFAQELKESINTLKDRWGDKILTEEEKEAKIAAEKEELNRKVKEMYGIEITDATAK